MLDWMELTRIELLYVSHDADGLEILGDALKDSTA